MGRKLTAIRTHKRNKPKGIHKRMLVKSHKRYAPEDFGRCFSKSAKEECIETHQAIEKVSGKSFFEKISSILED